jgi:hypothetical protein
MNRHLSLAARPQGGPKATLITRRHINVLEVVVGFEPRFMTTTSSTLMPATPSLPVR